MTSDYTTTPSAERPALTARQNELLAFIRSFVQQNGYGPTLREIGTSMKITSTNGVNDHLVALERKGYIRRDALKSRAIVLVDAVTDEDRLAMHRAQRAFHDKQITELERRIANIAVSTTETEGGAS